MKNTIKEADVLRQVLDYLALVGIFSWRTNNTGIYDPSKKRFRSFSGLRGVSDVLGILNDGRLLAVECKRPGGKLTVEQEVFQQQVRDRGGVAFVATSLEELRTGLQGANYGSN